MNEILTYRSVDDFLKRFKGMEFTRYSSIGYVYICEYCNYTKIGSTTQPKKRIKQHELNARVYGDNRIGLISITSFPFKFYKDLERFLHLIYEDKRKRSELFEIKHKQVFPVFVTEYATFLRFLSSDSIANKNQFDSVLYDYVRFTRNNNV